jgi:hypothetical protein
MNIPRSPLADPGRARRLVGLGIAALVVVLAAAACAATQPRASVVALVPGFWKGFWHGFIAPITFVISLFSDDVRIYAFPNGGRWYDFGFMLGISGFSGGVFAGSRSTPAKRTDRP